MREGPRPLTSAGAARLLFAMLAASFSVPRLTGNLGSVRKGIVDRTVRTPLAECRFQKTIAVAIGRYQRIAVVF